ncbi:MAG: DeoR/GlpR family DNA-binding transcription regulator [Pseudomonadota bacterium]
MSRNKSARQRQILMELEQRPALRVGELARRLSVSSETIRRDLDDLTADGLIDRTYGGALRRLTTEPSLNERHALLVPEREAIARTATPLLAGARHLMMGSGATTVHIARRIAVEMRDITVITHSFGAATALSLNPTIEVIMVPGRYHPSEGALHGAETLHFLEGLRADWAILGASGLSDEGPSDALLDAGTVYSAMARRAARTMIVADASKFGLVFPSAWAKWETLDTLVADQAPSGPIAHAIEDAQVALRVANH